MSDMAGWAKTHTMPVSFFLNCSSRHEEKICVCVGLFIACYTLNLGVTCYERCKIKLQCALRFMQDPHILQYEKCLCHTCSHTH
ncbi:hypothetical protein AB205_0131530, partial [Aquarana catesbeiana]